MAEQFAQPQPPASDRYGGIAEPYDAPVPYSPGHPDDGGSFAQDADLTVYWPRVRPCWEEQ